MTLQYEDPTEQVQQLRETLELHRALACLWLIQLASGAIAVVAAQHEHTHANGYTAAGGPTIERGGQLI